MNKYLFALAFLLGAAGIAWVGIGFIDASWLALAMTLLIAIVYAYGGWELRQFRIATAGLSSALASIPDPLESLSEWLRQLPAALQAPVRMRVEGERVALPGPALTPYLVGLLVMLGMLGTFLGMVVTLKGAVFALEKTTDLQAIRTALALPVKGLGLAFGTSVAGVLASAMLGLMSALARRERAQAAQLLDAKIATILRPWSLAHQRQESFKAMQVQSTALPALVERMQAMMAQMEDMGQQLNQRLLSNQEAFHGDVKSVYTELASSVDRTLRESLSQGAQAAGASIKPVVEAAMRDLAEQARLSQERVAATVQTQLETVSSRFADTAEGVATGWSAAQQGQQQANAEMLGELRTALHAFKDSFAQGASDLQAQLGAAQARQQTEQAEREQEHRQAWTQALHSMADNLAGEMRKSGEQAWAQQQAVSASLARSSEELAEREQQQRQAWTQALQSMADGLNAEIRKSGEAALAQQQAISTSLAHSAQEMVEREQQQRQAWTQALQSLSDSLANAMRESGEHTLSKQQAIFEALSRTSQEMAEQARASARDTMGQTRELLAGAEQLLQARMESEAGWLQRQDQRAEQLASSLRQELAALRDEEAARGKEAVERLGQLQTALAGHLSTLGAALEAPITRLIETASQAPRAAAEVIAQLRQEMSHSLERDNALLEERSRIMETLNNLLEAINHASQEQRGVIDSLVANSSAALDDTAERFANGVTAESTRLAEAAAQVSTSAVDMASLAEAFGFAVQSFNEANEKLLSNMQRMEETMEKSLARSDEQLAYYVAQAREIIDLSMSSQRLLVEELRQVPARPAEEQA